MASTRNRSRPSRLVVVVLLCALAVGAAASIIVAARAAAPFVPSATPELFVSNGIVILFLAILFGALIATFIHQQVGAGSAIPGRAMVTSLVVVLGLVLFVVLYRYIQGSVYSPPGTGNSSSPGSPSGGNTPPSGPSLGGGGGGTFQFLHVPSWTLFALIAIVSVVVAAVVVPRVRNYLVDRRERHPEPSEEQEVRHVLGRAAERLAAGNDARGVILELYAGLLARVEPLAGNIDPSTPEEIRTQHLIRLGIRAEAASELTRLFEEARYSSHPLGPDATERASRAVRTAEADLRRTAPLP